MATDGSNFFVVWQDGRTAGQSDNIYGVQVTSSGVVTTADGFEIATQGNAEILPDLVNLGPGSYAVSWNQVITAGGVATPANHDVLVRRVNADGPDTPAAISVAAGTVHQTGAVTAGPGHAHYAWTTPSPNGSDVVATRSNAVPTSVLSGTLVTRADNAQTLPSVGFDGTQFLVAWSDNRIAQNARDIYGVRVTPAGAKLDAQAIRITADAFDERSARVTGGADGFLVAYERAVTFNDVHVRYALVNRDGGVALSGDSVHPAAQARRKLVAATFDGTQHLVTFDESSALRMSRVLADGTVLDNGGVTLLNHQRTRADADLTTAGARSRLAAIAGGSPELATTTHVDSSAAPVASGYREHTDAGVVQSVAVATDGLDFLVVWHDVTNAQLLAQRALSDGGAF